MSCPEEFELFQLREGGLTEDRETEVAGHVASCAECQATLAELEALGAAIAAPEPMSESDRAAFVAGVVQKLDATPTTHATWTGWRKAVAVVVPVAAVLGCGVFALATFTLFAVGADRSAPAAVASGEALEANQQPPTDRFAQFEEAPAEAPSRGASRYGITAPAPAAPSVEAEADESGRDFDRGLAQHLASASGGGSGPSKAARPGGASRMEGLNTLGGADLQVLREAQTGLSAPSADLRIASAPPPGRRQTAERHRGHSLSGSTYATSTVARAQPQPSAIDPNGRFATTYRPGRGHLARFESTLLKGRAPEAAVALVGDVGRGSGPTVDAPTEKAIGLHVSTELRQADPGGGPCHLAITLRSSDQRPTGRPDIAVHLVMDTSGSMSGAAIDQARAAAAALVSMLEPGDRFSLTSYNSDASLVVPEGPVGARRTGILGMIGRIRAGGGTNLEAGLRMGYDQARSSRAGRDSVQLVIVLSDGRANQGITDPWALSEMAAAAFQSGFETTSIGVGDDYDPMVMGTLADYGAGGYYYLPDASAIEGVIRAELDVRSQPVARGVELRVRLADGVELLQAYGSRRLNELEASRVRATEVAIDHSAAHRDGIARDRQEDREGGMRFFIPGFARDDQHTILLRLRLPPGQSASELSVADLELRYKDRILGRNGGEERRVAVTYAPNRAAAIATQDRDVRRAVLSFRTGEALSQVATHVAAGEQPRALAILHERSALLQGAADQLDDATLRAEAHRLDAFRAMLASQGIGNRLMLGAIVQRASSGMMR